MNLRRAVAIVAAGWLVCQALHAQPDTGGTAGSFTAVEATIERARADVGATFGMALQVYDRQDKLVYTRMWGDFPSDRRVPIASASKMVAGTLLLVLVDRGVLKLDSTTGEILGWTGPKGKITLRQLLGQVSGLSPEVPCLNDTATTLAACVDAIRDDARLFRHEPGTQFTYGGGHFQVAARMAEVASGKTWNDLFTELLGRPLSLHPETNFYTSPWLGLSKAGTTNPRIAGGMVASMNDYARLLAVPFHLGTFGGHAFSRPSLFEDMGTEPSPSAILNVSPMASISNLPFRYGFGAWIECLPSRPQCPLLSSPGLFGFTPWLDRDSGYYAVLGTYRLPPTPADINGIIDFSVQLEQRLKPLLAEALRR
jgi:CubicO group peptidase (beta-lactamase class C family)